MLFDDVTTLGSVIRAARRDAGLTQRELATNAGISRQTVMAIERGHTHGELGAVLALLRALGLGLSVERMPERTFDLDTILENTEEP